MRKREVLEWLITKPDGVYVDCTLGGGGHSAALLSALGAGARVIGLDRDPDALREASARLAAEAEVGRFQAVRSNFAAVGRAVRECELMLQQPPLAPEASTAPAPAAGVPPRTTSAGPLVDGILVDLGVSSHQIDDEARGFSFSADGPLDMRMEGTGDGDSVGERSGFGGVASTSREHEDRAVEKGGRGEGGGGGDGRGGGGGVSAADVVNFADESEIREMVWRYGDEKRSTKIARAIVENRPIATTGQLAEVVGRCAPPKERVKTLARVFQALRIEVNGELDALEALLEQAKHLVRPGGRLLILSYHSLEDRRVKRVLATGNLKFFATGSRT
ncbi:S-adenosyl-methyltransferase MraW [Ectocarpus siliculosus]|uniref:S-adenosyl-methyltransferase MraW n=1 Tax=Ectocarpus siliculosus TaxID=2880 RepID=D7FXR7_ECTSI|nr:S-adenosyl-methyltransferase MraW [Ectocarpus siliculosus]|eukprot:CBJ32330.1 S-adenosyl-methyltransferase MraW [Ectocarpus siliculosus]